MKVVFAFHKERIPRGGNKKSWAPREKGSRRWENWEWGLKGRFVSDELLTGERKKKLETIRLQGGVDISFSHVESQNHARLLPRVVKKTV